MSNPADAMNEFRIGERLFTDGITRPVFINNDHRQYDGERVYGVWIYRPEDYPDYLPTPSCTNTELD